MYIKSLIIDGFKSYKNQVELKDFDAEFNAITGLNGSGKSNILDAICFALGISTLSDIRVDNIQNVIYKSGQADVHRASVTIIFDNKDKSRSSPFYADQDEITVSREVQIGIKNMYRINNVIVPAKKVYDLFNILHMNVNNPHFIIMQGRVTKVLNMKPEELLSIFEEATGTNLYERKKKNIIHNIAKKDDVIREIQNIANEEILPAIKTFKNEKQMAKEFSSVQDQLRNQEEKLNCFTYAYLHVKTKKSNDKCEQLNKTKKDKLEFALDLKNKIEEKKLYLKILTGKIDINNQNILNEIQTKTSKVEKEKYSIQYEISGYENNINSQEKKIEDMKKQISNVKSSFDLKKKEIEDFSKIFVDSENKKQKSMEELEKVDKKIRLLNSGTIFDEEDNGLVQDNINKFYIELQNQQSDNQQNVIKVDGLKNKLSKYLTGMEEAQKTYDMQMAELVEKEKEYEKVINKYHIVNEELSHHNNLRQNRDILLRDICDLNLKLESFESNNPSLFFQYNDPCPNFDRRQVLGLVCRLFEPIDFKYELSLTTLAGNKLYFVITQDDATVKDILNTNTFPNRMNFIPLNKIKSSSLLPNIIKIAQQIGGADKVIPALSLIKFDKLHLKAMQWVFGQAFVCATKEIAAKVCFDPRIRKHCFTLEGDHLSPSGTLTGGANTQKLILQAIVDQNLVISQLKNKKSEFSQLDNRLTAIADLPNKVLQLSYCKIMVEDNLKKIKSTIHLGKSHQQVTEVNNIKQQISELEKKLVEGKVNEKQLTSKINILESKIKNVKNILKQQLSEAVKIRENIFAKIMISKDEYEKKKHTFNKLELEEKDLASQMEADKNQLAELKAEKSKLDDELNKLKSKSDKVNQKYEMESKKLKYAEEELTRGYDEIVDVKNSIKDMNYLLEEAELFLFEFKSQIENAIKEHTFNQNLLCQLDNKLSHQKEKALEMDYINFDQNECKQSVLDLQNKLNLLSKIVDPARLNYVNTCIAQFKELNKQLDAVENNKNKIHEVIGTLDVKKCEFLQQALDQVNNKFGNIFSSVLPGTQACLRQVNPNNINDGLEIDVAFNGLWKGSLEELSGSERSLVALSLVLAMLLFNPVHFYILDEIDAALDYSHTQNIGKMLKQNFKQSQFIIVSLKDGMFNNANVLFRTKLIDESSTVTRTTCNKI